MSRSLVLWPFRSRFEDRVQSNDPYRREKLSDVKICISRSGQNPFKLIRLCSLAWGFLAFSGASMKAMKQVPQALLQHGNNGTKALERAANSDRELFPCSHIGLS